MLMLRPALQMLQADTALMGLNLRRLVVWFMKHSEGMWCCWVAALLVKR